MIWETRWSSIFSNKKAYLRKEKKTRHTALYRLTISCFLTVCGKVHYLESRG